MSIAASLLHGMNRWTYIILYLATVLMIMGCGASYPLAKETKGMTDLERADHYAMRGLTDDAISLYTDLINKNVPDAIEHLHALYVSEGKYDHAISLLTETQRPRSPRLNALLAEDYFYTEQYSESLALWTELISDLPDNHRNRDYAQRKIDHIRLIIDLINNPYDIEVTALPSGINTEEDEYDPQWSIDGKYIVFTRKVGGQEDIFIGTIDGENIDVQPVANLNTKYNEGAHTISAEGDYIVFTHCNDRYGRGSCDLYEISRVDGQWRKPQAIKGNINTSHWESQPSLSADGRDLYFASSRPGGIGGSDIWQSRRGPDGWQKAKNLGKKINTIKDEMSPFIHADGRTLYFSSNGHPGLGGRDLFLSRKVDKTTWSTPQNLGLPINTKGDDRDIIISLDGQSAYYATHDSTDVDIYRLSLPEVLRPAAMTYVAFDVIDGSTGEPLEVGLLAKDDNGTEIYSATDQTHFVFAIPVAEDVLISVGREDYSFYSEYVHHNQVTHGVEPIYHQIKLEPLYTEDDTPESAPIVMKNIFFATGSAELLPASDIEIDYLYQYMQKHPNPIKILGHTDDVGPDSDNLALSQRRADAVRQALIERGIDGSRLSAIGMGETSPVADNTTEDGRQKNRRTEVVIIKKWSK